MDIVDNVGRANGMLVSPTLFGLTHDELAEEERERAEARNNDRGMMSLMVGSTPLINQKHLGVRSLEKAHLESAKLLSLMRMTPLDLYHPLDHP